jgi:hypothetical protein
MRPKARGLAQHGGPPGWLEESDPAVWFCTWWTGHTACRTNCPYRRCPVASWWNFQVLLYCKCTHSSVMSYITQGRHGWPGTLGYHAFSLTTTISPLKKIVTQKPTLTPPPPHTHILYSTGRKVTRQNLWLNLRGLKHEIEKGSALFLSGT